MFSDGPMSHTPKMARYVASATRQEDERTATPVQTAGNAAIKDDALVRHRILWPLSRM